MTETEVYMRKLAVAESRILQLEVENEKLKTENHQLLIEKSHSNPPKNKPSVMTS